jgi:predicted HTH transcriptional regulator
LFDWAKCQLIVMPDTIVIKSPGGPVEPITLKQLQAFNAPMFSRNPTLHYVFGRMELAEERGLGLKTMRESAARAGLPLPKYSWEGPYLALTLYRSAESAARSLDKSIARQMSDEEREGWTFLASRTATCITTLCRENLRQSGGTRESRHESRHESRRDVAIWLVNWRIAPNIPPFWRHSASSIELIKNTHACRNV